MHGAALLTNPTDGWADRVVENVLPGAATVVFGGPLVGVEGRFAGLELRDTFAILRPGPSVCFAFLFRKSFSVGTVAEQILKTGTGGLNVEACRVGFQNEADQASAFPGGKLTSRKVTGGGLGCGYKEHERGSFEAERSTSGRWPPNVLFIHTAECQEVGTKKVSTGTAVRHNIGKSGHFGSRAINPDMRDDVTFADADGKETVPAWECTQECPVRLLDQLSGELTSGMMVAGQQRVQTKGGGGYHGNFPDAATNQDTYGDSGGASRFFHQFMSEDEVLDWFRVLVTPPGLSLYEDQ